MVASSLVCLPALDAGGAGPKVESWAFGTDVEGLEVLMRNRVFGSRSCKLCDDGVVVLGEYGLTNILMAHGYNIATLMARYRPVRPTLLSDMLSDMVSDMREIAPHTWGAAHFSVLVHREIGGSSREDHCNHQRASSRNPGSDVSRSQG